MNRLARVLEWNNRLPRGFRDSKRGFPDRSRSRFVRLCSTIRRENLILSRVGSRDFIRDSAKITLKKADGRKKRIAARSPRAYRSAR
jgi:hypothetical protein